jgi:hypothetical protein
MAKDSGFDRDFGYLIPFLDRVSAAADNMSPESRAELQRLLSGEKEKWQRIRSLLTGGAAAAPAPSAAATAATRAGTAPKSAAPALPTSLTVGSLRGGR